MIEKKATRVKQVFIIMLAALVMLVSAAALTPRTAFAAEPGVYTVTTQPTYENPITGAIEDSGTNQALGESMVSGVLKEQALLEVSERSTTYVTIRFALMDNIGDIAISYSANGQEEFIPVEYEVTQENAEDHTADLRFEVPDESVVVKYDFYVVPMGRNVIFFSTFTDPVLGESDFIVDTNLNADTSTPDTEIADSETPLASSEETSPLPYVVAGAALVVLIALIGYIVYRRQLKKRQSS